MPTTVYYAIGAVVAICTLVILLLTAAIKSAWTLSSAISALRLSISELNSQLEAQKLQIDKIATNDLHHIDQRLQRLERHFLGDVFDQQ